MSGKDARTQPEGSSSRADSVWASLVLGLPLSGGVLALLNQPWFEGTLAQRYTEHPIEVVEIVVFCCALAALLFKLWGRFLQGRALRSDLLPEWDGTPQPVAEAETLLEHLAKLPRSLRNSWVGQRCRGVLDYLGRRGSAAGLDDHVRIAADNDAMGLDSSYSYIRFLIWATPILGFLGTVLGITEAIAGVSPEQLEKDLTSVTGGLATAFDTTGLALMLTMVMMFFSFLVERLEQKTLSGVDEYVDEHLYHRFSRPESENSPHLAAMEHLVQRQAEVWSASMQKMQSRLNEEEERIKSRLTQSIAQAMQQSLAAHQEQLVRTMEPIASLAGALRQQVTALRPMAQAMTSLGQTLAQMQEQEGELVRLQKLLQHNLAGLAEAGAFEEAVHSLTAAVHLLTARTGLRGALHAAVEDRSAA